MALSDFTQGTDGIRQRDYRVYIKEASLIGGSLTSYITTKNKINLLALIAAMEEFGECRADSIDVGIDKGDTIQGNTLGEIVMNKACTFTAELINATPENIAALETIDRTACVILLVEKDARVVGAALYKVAILINNFVVNYSEKITGGTNIVSTISIADNTPTASAFRMINEITVT